MEETTTPIKKLSPTEVKHELWRRGKLDYLLKGKQIEISNAIKNSTKRIDVIVSTRRFGKTFVICKTAAEICVTTKNAIIKYLCPEQITVQKNIIPIFRQIFEDCPIEMRPEWKEAAKEFLFPNGSRIQIAGAEKGHIEKLRGG